MAVYSTGDGNTYNIYIRYRYENDTHHSSAMIDMIINHYHARIIYWL